MKVVYVRLCGCVCVCAWLNNYIKIILEFYGELEHQRTTSESTANEQASRESMEYKFSFTAFKMICELQCCLVAHFTGSVCFFSLHFSRAVIIIW